MYDRHLETLEFPKVLERLARYTSFSAGAELALALRPATGREEIYRRLETTREARVFLEERPNTGLGGAHDVRPQVKAALRGAVLLPAELLDIRDTLVMARAMHRTLTQLATRLPRLAEIASLLRPCPDLISEIERCLDERGHVRDEASPELSRLRREERIAHERIQEKLQSIISSPHTAAFLQEPIITMREGRYVIPLKADFKGRIRGIVHDVSASGATVFIEPLSVVELNNAWRELKLREEQEIERILTSLSRQVAAYSSEIEQSVEALAQLDLAFAAARYAEALQATVPEIVPWGKRGDRLHPGSTIHLEEARHPLLDPERVVPIDVVLDEETYVLVITGPNTGGKTVTLKTVGLLVLMAQAGLHVPARAGARLSPFEAVYADIGDEQSIEQNLSTFSAHLTNILSFLNQADEHSLVLLDELGAGTDPAEGAALARALLDHFRKRGVTTFVATHYPELKAYAQLTPGVRNACVEFDPQTLSPTYKLTIGLPGRSNAFAIARRLGLPEEIVAAARHMVAPETLRTEDMLADIHNLRLQAARARDAALASQAEAERLARELRARLESIEQERLQILEQARAEAAAELEALRAELRALRRRLQFATAPQEELAAVEQATAALAADLTNIQARTSVAPAAEELLRKPLCPGDRVWVRPLQALGEVLEIHGKEAEVMVGPARTRVSLAALEPRPSVSPEHKSERDAVRYAPKASPGIRLDLRGCTVDEALERLDQHLDAALRAGLPWIHIIHGKGTGALRQAVRRFLSEHPAVHSCEPGDEREGGDGVTIARLEA
ncbi:MAG: endonuclease MutS2 [Anaerolineae bacterium]|nr:endonuclease MutS2 [Anaerolineae bacterium]